MRREKKEILIYRVEVVGGFDSLSRSTRDSSKSFCIRVDIDSDQLFLVFLVQASGN